MDQSSFRIVDVSGTTARILLAPPQGNFDTLQLSIQLLSTISNNFFVSNVSRPECESFTEVIGILKSKISEPIEYNNLCPLSSYSVTVITDRKGFNPVQNTKNFNSSNFCSSLTQI